MRRGWCGRRRCRRRPRARWRSRSSRRAAASPSACRASRLAGPAPPASEPASGSDRANAGTTSPLTTPGIQRSTAGRRCRTGGSGRRPRPWRASAVSASVVTVASVSRSRHSCIAAASRGRLVGCRRRTGRAAARASPSARDQRPVDVPRGRPVTVQQVLAGHRPHPGDVLPARRQPEPLRVVGVITSPTIPPTLLRLDNSRQERNMLGYSLTARPHRPPARTERQGLPSHDGGSVRIAVIGGGPGGLYFSALAQQLARRPASSTRSRSGSATPPTTPSASAWCSATRRSAASSTPTRRCSRDAARVRDLGRHRRPLQGRGRHQRRPRRSPRCRRRRLLEILQERCAELGVTLHFRTEAPDVDELAASYDLVVACDGLNSAVRQRYADTFRPTLDVRDCRYIWLGTDKVFDAFKFYIAQTPYGVMQIHGYPFDATGSTFIVEMTSAVWARAGFARLRRPRRGRPASPTRSRSRRIRELFADVLGGHEVMANNSRWISLHHRPQRALGARQTTCVLLGDAAHTAHFSIGSGTKLAMEDALSLAACLHEEPTRRRGADDVRGGAQGGRALHPARGAGQPRVVREPRAVRPPGAAAVRVQHHDPHAPGHLRQPARARPGVRGPLRGLVRRRTTAAAARHAPDVPAGHPARRRGTGLELNNRVVVSPMDMYVARRRRARPSSTSCTSAARRSAAPAW